MSEKTKVPIFADEVYYGMVFPGSEFHSFGNLSKDVPMIVSKYI